MDSSNLQSALSSSCSMQSNGKLKADNSMNSVSSQKFYFTGPYSLQEWSLPDSFMYYIAMNPKSAEVYQKLVKSCKFFYIKNPILVVPRLLIPQSSLSSITSKTVSELAKIPHFTTLTSMEMCGVPESFDLDALSMYTKTNKMTVFYLEFADSISHAYKNRLEAIIDEIIETKTHDYKPIIMKYSELDEEKFRSFFVYENVVLFEFYLLLFI
uniref:Uncharacterized protein n=1 Tax=Panagrolaimus sp. ES5 TaxID=591445 RepID=A0AC34FWQ4_9BILA